MKKLGLVGLMLVLFTTIIFAQEQEKKRKQKLNPEAKAALKELREKEIYPTRKALYDEFMAQLSAEDKAYLEGKRQEATVLKEKAKAARKQLKADKQAGKEVDRKTVFAPIKEQRKALVASMQPFLESKHAALNQVMDALNDHQQKWQEQKIAIIKEHTTAEEQQKMKAFKEKKSAKREAMAQENGIDEEQKWLHRAARFVLWDGEMKTRERGGKR